MTNAEIDSALEQGEQIFTAHRLDNGEQITGRLSINTDNQAWIDDGSGPVEVDCTKPFFQIVLSNED